MLTTPCRLTTYMQFPRTLASHTIAAMVAAGWFVPLSALAEAGHPPHELSAADQTQAMADELQGKAYQNGASVSQDYAKAARLYRSSASKGLALGQYYLDLLYVAGLGVPQDYVEATRWLRAAGEQGDADAQLLLGVLYYNGQGVERSYQQAPHWFHLGVAKGRSHAAVQSRHDVLDGARRTGR